MGNKQVEGLPLDLVNFQTLRSQIKKSTYSGILLSVDPGETTGVSVFKASPQTSKLLYTAQIETWPLDLAVPEFGKLFNEYSPSLVVYEAYHIYSWRLDEHRFSEVPTIQIIGCLKTLAIQHQAPTYCQTAQVGKGFVTDDKLKQWSLYFPGLQHSRDSLRHGCHYLLFDKVKTSPNQNLTTI